MMKVIAGLMVFASVQMAAAQEVARSEGSARRQIVLSDGWQVKQLEIGPPDIAALTRESAAPDPTWLTARMPAQVHDLLLARGVIPDPHIGTNATASAWVGEKNWVYVCRFPTPDKPRGPVFLRLEGLDTLADAYLNGASLGHFENMFREYAIDVKQHLAPSGESNVLIVVFSSPLRYQSATRLPLGDSNSAPHRSLRKCHSDFSSYLGARPHAVKVGVYRDVLLDLPEESWMDDLWVRSALSPNLRSATVQVRAETSGSKSSLRWVLTDPAGREVSRGQTDPSSAGAEFDVVVPDPLLWWPRMQGPQNLYLLDVSLVAQERVLDRRRTQFGIREVKPVLQDPVTGEKRFRFEINGRPVFLRGANWVPVEGATHVWQPERARQLLDLAEHGNMNMLRIWGEGVLPPPSFYEECDRRGICLWQDFMFGYYDHAKDDTVFLENCRAEIEGMIRRLRNHPSLLLWCGGNEQYLWTPTSTVSEAKREIFERLMPEACRRLDPTRLFHTSSPYGGSPTGNWPLEGDWHDYTTINFAPESSVPLFGSEVLRASVPPLRSMKRFLSEEELWPKGFDPAIRKSGQPAWPPAWSYHSTGLATWDRVGPVHEYCDPKTAEELIRVVGMAHGEYLRDRVERERRGVPDGLAWDHAPSVNRRCWGNLVWRLNDSWPMIYGSMVDYYLEPKIAHYFLRRAYEPILVSFEKTPDRIGVWVVNDSSEPVAGTLAVRRLDFAGKEHGRLQAEVALQPGESKRGLITTALGEINLRSQFLAASFANIEATCLLLGERYLHLPQAHLKVRRVEGGLEIVSDTFARGVTIELDGATSMVLDDNFFDLSPGRKRTIALRSAEAGRMVTVRALNAESISVEWKP